jgi:chromosome segregation ATPase
MPDDLSTREDEIARREKELREKSEQFTMTMKEFETLAISVDKQKAEMGEEKGRLEGLRNELTQMSMLLDEQKQKIEEEVEKRVKEALSRLKDEGALSEALRKEIEENEKSLKNFENDVMARESDNISKERTIAAEIDRLEVERAEIGELWEKLDAAKQSIAPSMDPELVEKQRKEFEEKFVELSRREDAVKTDEQQLKIEWARLRNLEQELMHMANQLMEKNQDKDKKPKKPSVGPVGIREI